MNRSAQISIPVFILLYSLLSLSFCVFAQSISDNTKLSSDVICKLLEKRVHESEIIKQIEKYKVDFTLSDWKTTAKLVRAKASDTLLEVIDKSFVPSTRINLKFDSNWSSWGVSIFCNSFDNSYCKINGNSDGFPGYKTVRQWNIESRRLLCIRIENSSASEFIMYNRMLKVFVGMQELVLNCNNREYHSQYDPQFITKNDGVFRYTIPDEIVINGNLIGLGLVVGPGNIRDLQLSAWFE